MCWFWAKWASSAINTVPAGGRCPGRRAQLCSSSCSPRARASLRQWPWRPTGASTTMRQSARRTMALAATRAERVLPRPMASASTAPRRASNQRTAARWWAKRSRPSSRGWSSWAALTSCRWGGSGGSGCPIQASHSSSSGSSGKRPASWRSKAGAASSGKSQWRDAPFQCPRGRTLRNWAWVTAS